jgi:hypothetical protein
MTAFEFVCYAAAVLIVLWLRAEHQAATPIAVAPVLLVDDLPTLPELLAEAEVLTARPVTTVAAAVAAPVAIARVEVPTVDIAKMTSAELRKECRRRGIAWRGVRDGGKHLTKPQMVKALGA